jgi:hypothetical protein
MTVLDGTDHRSASPSPARSSARRRPAPAGMSQLDQLLAYEQIRQLAARYALAINQRDLDGLLELFYGVDSSPSPLDQEPAHWPQRVVGRGTLPFDWPSWQSYRPSPEQQP